MGPGASNAAIVGNGPVLICYDGSPEAERAIAAAGELLSGRQAVVVSVGPLPVVVESYTPGGPDIGELDRLTYEDALARAESGAEHAGRAGFEAEARANVDSPTWEGVVEVADDVDASVIVVGSRGLTGIHERIEGSLSHDLAQHAHRPVLVVPPQAR